MPKVELKPVSLSIGCCFTSVVSVGRNFTAILINEAGNGGLDTPTSHEVQSLTKLSKRSQYFTSTLSDELMVTDEHWDGKSLENFKARMRLFMDLSLASLTEISTASTSSSVHY